MVKLRFEPNSMVLKDLQNSLLLTTSHTLHLHFSIMPNNSGHTILCMSVKNKESRQDDNHPLRLLKDKLSDGLWRSNTLSSECLWVVLISSSLKSPAGLMYVLSCLHVLLFHLLWNTIHQVSNFPFSVVSFPSPSPILITSAFDTLIGLKSNNCVTCERTGSLKPEKGIFRNF